MNKIVEEIKSLIKEASSSEDVHRLIEISMRISGLMVFFCEQEKNLFEAAAAAYNTRKQKMANAALSSPDGVTKAELQAERDFSQLRTEEALAEAKLSYAKNFRMQVNDFCDALRQKVGYLRREMETTKRDT